MHGRITGDVTSTQTRLLEHGAGDSGQDSAPCAVLTTFLHVGAGEVTEWFRVVAALSKHWDSVLVIYVG